MATHIAETSSTTEPERPAGWNIDAARTLYNVEGWGAGFFDINTRGHVVVRPNKERPEHEVDLYDVAMDLEEQGIALPVLLRFSDILRSRIESLTRRFDEARAEFGYTGGYTSVYPIKVNQQRHVVEEILEFGKAHGVGLECGSKPASKFMESRSRRCSSARRITRRGTRRSVCASGKPLRARATRISSSPLLRSSRNP